MTEGFARTRTVCALAGLVFLVVAIAQAVLPTSPGERLTCEMLRPSLPEGRYTLVESCEERFPFVTHFGLGYAEIPELGGRVVYTMQEPAGQELRLSFWSNQPELMAMRGIPRASHLTRYAERQRARLWPVGRTVEISRIHTPDDEPGALRIDDEPRPLRISVLFVGFLSLYAALVWLWMGWLERRWARTPAAF